jgi:hypothetical protein
MTMRASRANLSPKGTQHAPAKPAPKGAKPAQKTPSKVPAKASKPVAPSATKAPTASQPAKVTAASVSAKLDATKPSGPLGLTPADIRTAQTDPRNAQIKRSMGLTIPSEADMQAAARAAAQNAHTPLIAVKRMSAEERRYAKRRVEDIMDAKHAAFKREKEAGDAYEDRRRIFAAEVAAGRFTVDKAAVSRATYDTDLRDVVVLTNYPDGLGAHVRTQQDAIAARQATMKAAGARLLDEIMLGSPADAIERIQHFENTKF